jgi:beta-lactamase regulating signal transducer with metallopeptidase domain
MIAELATPFVYGAAWLWTFALHGSAILLAAIVVSRWLARDAARLDLLWRYSCFAGLLTASMQCLVQDGPWLALPIELRGVEIVAHGPAGSLPAIEPAGIDDATALGSASMSTPQSIDRARIELDPLHLAETTRSVDPSPRLDFAAVPRPTASAAEWASWSDLGVYGALALAGVGVARWLLRRLHVSAWLRDRAVVAADDPIRATLDALRSTMGVRSPVRLSRSERLLSPVAFGAFRPEICLPVRAGSAGAAAHVPAMLAHELAHLKRRDPLWLMAVQCMRALFPWQPLLGISERRMRAVAERRCDAMAARAVGPIALAECLVEVAQWVRDARPEPSAMLASMAVAKEGVRSRVEHLLQHEARDARRLSSPGSALTVAVLTAAFAAALPGATVRSPVSGSGFPLDSIEVLDDPAPAAETTATSAMARVTSLLAVFDAERAALAIEVETLLRGSRRLSADQRTLLAEIELRIARLDRLRSRVTAAIAAQSQSSADDGSSARLSENPR